MHEGDPVGYLTFNGKPATTKQLAVNANCTLKEAERFLRELEEAGVFSRSENGTIFCRRMVRDAQEADIARDNGKKGGNPKLKGVNPPLNPPVNGGVKAKSTESELEEERGPPRSPRRRGDFPPSKLSVTDQIRRDWNLGTFLAPDICDDDEPPDRRLMS
jgi:hypothetical protein